MLKIVPDCTALSNTSYLKKKKKKKKKKKRKKLEQGRLAAF